MLHSNSCAIHEGLGCLDEAAHLDLDPLIESADRNGDTCMQWIYIAVLRPEVTSSWNPVLVMKRSAPATEDSSKSGWCHEH